MSLIIHHCGAVTADMAKTDTRDWIQEGVGHAIALRSSNGCMYRQPVLRPNKASPVVAFDSKTCPNVPETVGLANKHCFRTTRRLERLYGNLVTVSLFRDHV